MEGGGGEKKEPSSAPAQNPIHLERERERKREKENGAKLT
jgi:hypothetical protein